MFSMVLVSLSVICSVCIANVHHRTPGKFYFSEFSFEISPKYRKYYFKRFIQCRIGCIKYFFKHFRQVWENSFKVAATLKVSLQSSFILFSIDSLYFSKLSSFDEKTSCAKTNFSCWSQIFNQWRIPTSVQSTHSPTR